ncbi:hypothetical protein LBMAG49_19290 [Planctomycetota bacterium]|nr:hypothetical protein LBMAG49_19290 [Planctomycetota bacterium]
MALGVLFRGVARALSQAQSATATKSEFFRGLGAELAVGRYAKIIMKKTLKTLASLSLLLVAACESSGNSSAAPAVSTGGACCSAEGKASACCAEESAPTVAPVKKQN